jgi:hypothetical protein
MGTSLPLKAQTSFNVGKLANLTSNLIQKIKSRNIIEAKFMTEFDLA